jgi:type I restriction enzyme S subunit
MDDEAPIKGEEVGSQVYMKSSNYFFMRTQAISDFNFILNRDEDSFVPITKNAFEEETEAEKNSINVGDIFYVKGGNVGAVGISDISVNARFSSHLLKLKINSELRDYVFAILKNDFGRLQINNLPIGAIEGLDTFKVEYLNKIIIPFPNYDSKETMVYVSLLVRAVIRKEMKIKENSNLIYETIKKELLDKQNPVQFLYSSPTYKELESIGRFDSSLYSEEYKKATFLIENYSKGAKNVYSKGFNLSRGQNLQVSGIGKSVYLEVPQANSYEVFLPKYITTQGTVSKILYLGNKNPLKCLEKGDIVFGAEGFEKGRSIVITEDISNTITNIHGIVLKSEKHDLTESIFVKCFLDYLRREGLIDKYAVGGNGGSLAQQYWELIKFPEFTDTKKAEIARFYHNTVNYDLTNLDINSFESEDVNATNQAGILQLDRQVKAIKAKLDAVIRNIVDDKVVEKEFMFLSR